jgi:hypothetical protein
MEVANLGQHAGTKTQKKDRLNTALNEKSLQTSVYKLFPGAQNWIRTSTSLRTLRPEHSASTNFAIWASESGLQI